ncbi:MAG: T9SS type A sorting domain-containing protein [Ignavibacteria bacterium]|nr:T9SS type A sorting domain-containing protein [Ignavibacteria bacterium]
MFAVDLTQTPTSVASCSASSKPDLIYPNPTSGSITVSCSSSSPAVAWSIYTNSGVMVAHGELDVNIDNENNTYNIQLPLGLAPSVYILIHQNADGVKTCAYRVMTL